MKKNLLFFLILLVPFSPFAQSVFVSNGSSFYVEAFQIVSFDSLALRPTAAFSITGPNAVYHNQAIVNFAPQATITRALKFDTPIAGFTGKISLYYSDAELASLTEPNLVLSNHDGTKWTSYNTGIARNATTNEVSMIVSNFTIGELTLSSQLNPLPLLWRSVSVAAAGQSNNISWTTTDESSCNYFVVERSITGNSWEACSEQIPARNEAGPNRYSWSDFLFNDTRYYRIRLVNLDNSSSYSRTIAVHRSLVSTVTLYPNPATDKLVVSTSDPSLRISRITIYSTGGARLHTVSATNGNSAIIELSTLSRGTYLLATTFSNGEQSVNTFQKN